MGMLQFNPRDPFPLLAAGKISPSEAQAHAEAVDHWLGLEVKGVEAFLLTHGCRAKARGSGGEQQELWIGLNSRCLLTPYTEIRALLERLRPTPNATVVDLGAAYGRIGLVLARHFPACDFIGYEYVGERVAEARRCIERFAGVAGGGRRIVMEHVDLTALDFKPAPADYYFIYDYGTTKAIEKTLHDLRRISLHRAITVVARGRRCHEAIDRNHRWLAQAFPSETNWSGSTVYCSDLNSTYSTTAKCGSEISGAA